MSGIDNTPRSSKDFHAPVLRRSCGGAGSAWLGDAAHPTAERTAAGATGHRAPGRAHAPRKEPLRNTRPKVATKRKRISPFTSKKVAARQSFRCAMCGELLTEDWETDHIVPLHSGLGSFDDEIDSLQALHKRCHAFKRSLEQRKPHK